MSTTLQSVWWWWMKEPAGTGMNGCWHLSLLFFSKRSWLNHCVVERPFTSFLKVWLCKVHRLSLSVFVCVSVYDNVNFKPPSFMTVCVCQSSALPLSYARDTFSSCSSSPACQCVSLFLPCFLCVTLPVMGQRNTQRVTEEEWEAWVMSNGSWVGC